MKKIKILPISLLLLAGFLCTNLSAQANVDPNDQSGGGGISNTQGTLSFSPSIVKNGQSFNISLTGGQASSPTKLWVDNNDGKGFRDFGAWVTINASGNISVSRTLNCNSYQTLEPNQTVPIGNRKLVQKIYLEYVGLNKISGTATHTKDCTTGSITTNPDNPTTPPVSTNNPLFPYTVKSIFGTDYIRKAFPTPSQYTSPFKNFAGRYFDGKESGGTNTALGFEWYTMAASGYTGGDTIKTTGNKIYMLMGNTVAAYNKSTFAGRLANSANSSLAVFAGSKEPKGYDHGILPWDAYLYPEHQDNAWTFPRIDNHTGLTAFDVDDRGYIYFIDVFGFGIARDDGSNVRIQTQIIDSAASDVSLPTFKSDTNGTVKLTDMGGYGQPAFSFDNVNIVKAGGKYLAVITGPGRGYDGKSGTRILDVTDVSIPQFVRSAPDESITTLVQSGQNIAVTVGPSVTASANKISGGSSDGALKPEIRIYNADDFVSGAAPKKVFQANSTGTGAGYIGLALDKISGKFYSLHYSSNPRPSSSIPAYISPTASVSVFSPVAGSYSEQKYELSAQSMGGQSSTGAGWAGYRYIYTVEALEFSNGYLVSRGLPAGDGQNALGDIKIWIFESGVPKELDTNGFIMSYYSGRKVGQIAVETFGGKDYLFVSHDELADVYELTPSSGDISTNPIDPINPTPPFPTDYSALLNQPCATTFAGNLALINLCQQIKFVQQRSCSLVPGLSFCYGFKETN